MSAWFASERWIFSRHKGTKWLQDSLDDVWDAMTSIPPIPWLSEIVPAFFHLIFSALSIVLSRTRKAALGASSTLTNLFTGPSEASDTLEEDENSLPSGSLASPEPLFTAFRNRRGSEGTQVTSAGHGESKSPASPSTIDFSIPEKGGPVSAPASPGRGRFANAVRSVMMMRAASGGLASPHRKRTMSSSMILPDRRKETMHAPLKRSRVAALVPQLQKLATTQDLPAHQALVRHLQFSPDGKFLATSRWVR